MRQNFGSPSASKTKRVTITYDDGRVIIFGVKVAKKTSCSLAVQIQVSDFVVHGLCNLAEIRAFGLFNDVA